MSTVKICLLAYWVYGVNSIFYGPICTQWDDTVNISIMIPAAYFLDSIQKPMSVYVF